MYTASLVEKLIENGKIRWIVEFSNGTDSFKDSLVGGNYEWLKRSVASRLAELNTEVTLGPIDTTIVPPTQTQAEIDRDQWLRDWSNLLGAQKLIAAGVIADTLPAYVTLKNKVTTNFKNAYVTLL